MNINLSGISKSIDEDFKKREDAWKRCEEGKEPLIIGFTDCKNKTMRYKVLPKTLIYSHSNSIFLDGNGYKIQNVSQDISGQLSKKLVEIKHQRRLLLLKEQSLMKKYFNAGKSLKLNIEVSQ